MLVRVTAAKKCHFFFRKFSSIQNISVSLGKQYLSKREVRKLFLIINTPIIPPLIILPPLSFLSKIYRRVTLNVRLFRRKGVIDFSFAYHK